MAIFLSIIGAVIVLILVYAIRKLFVMAFNTLLEGEKLMMIDEKRYHDWENEQIYLQTKKNYKDNGIYEDNETNDHQ